MHWRIFIVCLYLLAPFQVAPQTPGSDTPSSKNQSQPKPSSEDSQKKIKIDHVKPSAAAATQTIAIVGSGFGDPGTVTIGKDVAAIISWDDNLILTTVPDGLAVGAADVVVKHNESDKVAYQGKFEVKAPEYDKRAFEVITGVGSSFLPHETTSYKVDNTNNALSQTNVGRKHIELLLGGAFILPRPEFKGKGEDPDYKKFRPLQTFLSIRFAPGSDQVFTGFVVGGGWRIHKYFSLLVGYSLTPIDEPSAGFRRAAAQVVAANPTIFPYNQYNATDLANNKPGAFDGFPLFLYNASGVTTTKIFPTSPTVTHSRSGIFFGVGIPVNLTSLLKPGSSK
jgi:IPT/TIG domain